MLSDETKLVRLWLHESARVFRDRLIDNDDRDWFNHTCEEMLSSHFGFSNVHQEDFRDMISADFLNPAQRKYQELNDPPKVIASLRNYLSSFNSHSPAQLDLVLFPDAVAHLARISCVLRQPRGNALLVGFPGSGRTSLARLATFIAFNDASKFFQIEITRGYGNQNWREDLQHLLRKVGLDDQPVVFCFNDNQIVTETFLEDINMLLNAGEVPNLFSPADVEEITHRLRGGNKASEANKDAWAFFTSQVRKNLHVILCFIFLVTNSALVSGSSLLCVVLQH